MPNIFNIDTTYEIVNGLCFGIEFLGKDPEEGIEESAIIVHLAFLRLMIWLCDNEDYGS